MKVNNHSYHVTKGQRGMVKAHMNGTNRDYRIIETITVKKKSQIRKDW